ncbi:hypothetical protein AUEXF2481DRAFT_33876 [Aureobasidium subglaciale EXF-2481]|uniref:Uncharacterized protein n=1 Tax=Aureobasidium subglaciale (strain EXF-2481) TaxID=1043005 RepID=A0A074YUP3_AURSE|nr:uncharacterized protein AUEXF2481DRAFT_33876 [Aureobasidium subglaciale EXF-2481]KEQ90546.1 hypothetical protein AUEXF2481DRAFT_33876 [Aureobasidium subglaciale EXF-2481]
MSSTGLRSDNCTIRVDDLPLYEPPQWHWSNLEAGEHKLTAEALKLRDVNGQILKANDIELATIKGTIKLKFGDIIALAGDFFTNREGKDLYFPICGAPEFGDSGTKDEAQRFKNAVQSLTEDTDGFLANLMKLLQLEHKAVVDTRSRDESVTHAYHTHACGIPTDEEWAKITGGLIIDATSAMHYLYAYIAYTNADHFGKDAITAYSVGHNIALQLAHDAAQMSTEAGKWGKLKEAYIYEAFASHYLTDLFSSGHIRAPRRYLHSSDVDVMNLRGVEKEILHCKETPIWNYQLRYMHDDDGATGILVKNKLGHQWIMYGDKQFFEPKNVVNRARTTHALQLSVDELFSAGVEADIRPSDDWRQNMAQFSVLEWIAQPMASVASDPWVESWGGIDIHNPAPLWQALSEVPDPVSGWTTRIDINDHSDLTGRTMSSPGLSEQWTFGPPFTKEAPGKLATKECIAVRDADFRGGDGQYPYEEMMPGLMSGGFVQIQHLRVVPHPEAVAVNWWRPMSVSIAGQRHENFTLYSRTLSLEPVQASPPLTGVKTLHWTMHFTKWSQLVLTHYIWAENKDAAGGDIHLRQYVFARTNIEHPYDGTKIELDIGHPGSMELIQTSEDVRLMSNVRSTKETNLARFLSGNYLSSSDARDTVRLAVYNSAHQVSKECSFLGMTMRDQDVVFTRSFKKSKDKEAPHAILLAKASSGNSATNCEFSRISFNKSADANRAVSLELSFKSSDSLQGPCVLVGDVFDLGADHAVCISGDISSVSIATFGIADSSDEMVFRGLHRCTMEETLPLVQPYLTALTPSIGGKGLDVLQISLHQGAQGRKKILFRTHTRNAQGPGQQSNPWSGCQQSEWYDDPLASNKDGRYFSMKWIRCRYKIAESEYWGVLEVFSWYGIIGTRLFGQSSSRYQYELVGQQPYLGQTSVIAGTGCTGDWSHGILPWTAQDDWVDSAAFQPWNRTDLRAGSWGMMKRDFERQRVEGWQVDKRPTR